MSSTKRDLTIFYLSQVAIAFIGLATLPLYIGYLGTEAFGLIGFYAVVQALFQLLDLGLRPTMLRETARFRAGKKDGTQLRELLRILELLFVATAATGAALLYFQSDLVTEKWLSFESLTPSQVKTSVSLIGVICALRWVSALYRGTINGFERFAWLGSFNLFVALVRFVLVIPFFIFISVDPVDYFFYQLILSVFEIAYLVAKTYRLLPKLSPGQSVTVRLAALTPLLSFSLTIAFTGSLWVLVTQLDKLLLSRLLPLDEYGIYTVAVVFAGGILMLTQPIGAALMPRLSLLHGKADHAAALLFYRQGTQFASVLAIPAALVMFFFPQQLLQLWLQNAAITNSASPVLQLYAIGNCILAVSAFPFYLQFSKGKLALHVAGSLLFLGILLALLFWATPKYGMVGAGIAWLCTNLLYFGAWTAIVHSRLEPGLHLAWLFHDIGLIALTTGGTAFVVSNIVSWHDSRWLNLLQLVAIGIIFLSVAAITSSAARTVLVSAFRRLAGPPKDE